MAAELSIKELKEQFDIQVLVLEVRNKDPACYATEVALIVQRSCLNMRCRKISKHSVDTSFGTSYLVPYSKLGPVIQVIHKGCAPLGTYFDGQDFYSPCIYCKDETPKLYLDDPLVEEKLTALENQPK